MKQYNIVNSIFEPLGYIVFPHRKHDNSNIWNIYVKGSNGLEYFGTCEVEYDDANEGYVFIPTNVDKDMLSKEICYSPEEFIDEIKYYNSKRIIPAYCCDPEIRPFGNIDRTFMWYMKTLGFEQPRWDEYSSSNIGCAHSNTMVLKNLYGEIISHITLIIDDLDKESGSIVRSIGKWGMSWTQSDFKNSEELIASINSIVEPEMLVNAAKGISATQNLTTDRSNNVSLTKIDNSLNIYTANAKNAIKKALTDALNNLD